MRKRDVLRAVTTVGTTALAGCAGIFRDSPGETPEPATATETETSTATETQTSGEPEISFEVTAEPAQMPAEWNNHNIEDFETGITATVSTPGQPVGNVTLKHVDEYKAPKYEGQSRPLVTETEETAVHTWSSDGETLEVDEFRFKPGINQNNSIKHLLEEGSNGLKLVLEDHDIEAEATVNWDTGRLFRVDFEEGVNEGLREYGQRIVQMENELFGDDNPGEHVESFEEYLEQAEPPGFNDNYDSHELIGVDKAVRDPAAEEFYHDDDFMMSSGANKRELRIRLTQGIPDPNRLTEVKDPENDEPAEVAYPKANTSNGQPTEYGSFDFDAFRNATSYRDAQAQIIPLVFNMEARYDRQPESTETEQMLSLIEEAVNRFVPDLDIHTWGFDLPEAPRSSHGNGLVYDETNDELRIFEPVSYPPTAAADNEGQRKYAWKDDVWHISPLVEDSDYLRGGSDFDRHWWHPLRGLDDIKNNLPFEEAKGAAHDVIQNIATARNDTKQGRTAVMTNQLLQDALDSLRHYNADKRYDFEEIKELGKTIHQLHEEDGNNLPLMEKDGLESLPDEHYYILDGTVDDYTAFRTDRGIVEAVMNDEDGEYNNIRQAVSG